MVVRPIKTTRVKAGEQEITDLLKESIASMPEASILAVASKVVALCENRVVPMGSMSKEVLIKQEADYYLPAKISKHGHHFSIIRNTLIGSAGIDNAKRGGQYILWPSDPQHSANLIRKYLANYFGLQKVGVIIADSMSIPLRRGSTGTAIAHSGFKALKQYKLRQANIAGGLAAAAVVAMGEGTEQTPLAIIEDVPFVQFQTKDPTPAEVHEYYLSMEDDLFAPFFKNAPWLPGNKQGD